MSGGKGRIRTLHMPTRGPYWPCVGFSFGRMETHVRPANRPGEWQSEGLRPVFRPRGLRHTRCILSARGRRDQTGRRESAELPNGRPWPPLTGACAVRIWKHTGKASAGPHKRFSGHVERATHMDLAEENQDVNTLQLPSVRHGSQWRKKARALAWTCCLLWTVESPRPRPGGRCTGAYLLPSIPGRP